MGVFPWRVWTGQLNEDQIKYGALSGASTSGLIGLLPGMPGMKLPALVTRLKLLRIEGVINDLTH